MTARIIQVPHFDQVVFGATGDLSARKLLPALYQRDRAGQMPAEARIIAASRQDQSHHSFRDWVATCLRLHIPAAEQTPEQIAAFLQRVFHVRLDVKQQQGWSELAAILNEKPDRIRSFYLAVAPELFGTICASLGAAGLATAQSRLVVEKPLGKNGEGARVINEEIAKVFSESQIYRIDHYLGKETVQNLMALRFANALFEPLWNRAHIDHVQITVAETLGLESRAGYYDGSGALRDMVQNHILQLLCLVAMEPPQSDHGNDLRDEKLKVLRALTPIVGEKLELHTVRGQYRRGASQEGPVAGYLEELQRENGATSSDTETFVALKAEIENWRWSGVPFYLRTGKRLAQRLSEIVVNFKAIPHRIFDLGAGTIFANQLVIRLQPDEGVKLWLMIKDPGPGGMRLTHVPLDMSFADAFAMRAPDAYERLLMDVIRGHQTLFMRRDEVEAAWGWIDPILDGWKTLQIAPKAYTAGTWGPSAAEALIERDQRSWHE